MQWVYYLLSCNNRSTNWIELILGMLPASARTWPQQFKGTALAMFSHVIFEPTHTHAHSFIFSHFRTNGIRQKRVTGGGGRAGRAGAVWGEKGIPPSLHSNWCVSPWGLCHSLDLRSQLTSFTALTSHSFKGRRGKKTHSKHLAQQPTSPAILWEQKEKEKKKSLSPHNLK